MNIEEMINLLDKQMAIVDSRLLVSMYTSCVYTFTPRHLLTTDLYIYTYPSTPLNTYSPTLTQTLILHHTS